MAHVPWRAWAAERRGGKLSVEKMKNILQLLKALPASTNDVDAADREAVNESLESDRGDPAVGQPHRLSKQPVRVVATGAAEQDDAAAQVQMQP